MADDQAAAEKGMALDVRQGPRMRRLWPKRWAITNTMFGWLGIGTQLAGTQKISAPEAARDGIGP